jgi:hypothetical protein
MIAEGAGTELFGPKTQHILERSNASRLTQPVENGTGTRPLGIAVPAR